MIRPDIEQEGGRGMARLMTKRSEEVMAMVGEGAAFIFVMCTLMFSLYVVGAMVEAIR